jgi:hypothetical protein
MPIEDLPCDSLKRGSARVTRRFGVERLMLVVASNAERLLAAARTEN